MRAFKKGGDPVCEGFVAMQRVLDRKPTYMNKHPTNSQHALHLYSKCKQEQNYSALGNYNNSAQMFLHLVLYGFTRIGV